MDTTEKETIITAPSAAQKHRKRNISAAKSASWIFMAAITLLTFLTMYYSDIYITSNESLLLLDCISTGNLTHFYDIASTSPVGPALYFIPIYIIYALWELPVWIGARSFGVDINSVGCLLWAKLLIVLFYAASSVLMLKIADKLKIVKKESLLFFFIGSVITFFTAAAMGQYDIIELTFILGGLYFYLKDERVSPRVLALFSIAISFKMFALFIFFILLIIDKKNPVDIILKTIESLFFSAIIMLPFAKSYSVYAAEFNLTMRNRMLSNVIPAGSADISLFCLFFFVVCIIAFLSKRKTVKENARLFIWCASAFWLIFFTFVKDAHPQWYILYVPFLLFLTMPNSRLSQLNMLFTAVLEICYAVIMIYTYNWVFACKGAFSALILRNCAFFNSGASYSSIGEYLNYSGYGAVISAFQALFFFCGLMLLIINNPWKRWMIRAPEGFMIPETVYRFVNIAVMLMLIAATVVINTP